MSAGKPEFGAYYRILVKDELGNCVEEFKRPFLGKLTMGQRQGRTVIIRQGFWDDLEEHLPSLNHSIEAHRHEP